MIQFRIHAISTDMNRRDGIGDNCAKYILVVAV